jgi:plasmid maintenance system antidote protein VapI
MAKKHGWLAGALADKGYQQHDLARVWKVDDAVVSRFISSGKPDLTPERQMILSQILGLTNDQLLARLYGDIPLRRIIQQPQPSGASHSSNPNSGGIEQAHAELKRAIDQLQELIPDATVTVTITYRGQ